MPEPTTFQTAYVAQIIEDATGAVVYQSKPTSQRRAEKIEDGMGINLDWASHSTRVILVPETAKPAR